MKLDHSNQSKTTKRQELTLHSYLAANFNQNSCADMKSNESDKPYVAWCEDTKPKKPMLVTERVAKCPIEVADVMAALRTIGELSSHGQFTNLGVWLDGRAAIWDYPRWLASASDHSVDTYVSRVLAQADASSFCYSQFNVQVYNSSIWEWATKFSKSYCDKVGWPRGEVDVDMFLGQYPRTPRGIHRDSADTLMFILKGTKRLLFWPADRFNDHIMKTGLPGVESLPGVSSEDYLEDAIVLEGGEGDAFFWPSDYWHVSEAADQPSSSMALNMSFHQSPSQTIVDATAELMQAVLPQLCHSSDDRVSASSAFYKKSDAALLELLREGAFDEPIRSRLEEWQMLALSAAGFHAVPPLKAEGGSTDYQQLWELRRLEAVTWRLDQKSASLNVAANGHWYSEIAEPTTLEWFRHLCDRQHPAELPPFEAQSLVAFLLNADALSLVRDTLRE